MSWRETLFTYTGSSLFGGTTLADWRQLLRDNRFDIDRRRWSNVLAITAGSAANSLCRRLEQRRYGERVARTTVPPPIFVLGHWRSGTTHLHNLLAQDRRFAFPNHYQVTYPHTFLTTEASHARLLGWLLPDTRIGLDNVKFGPEVPQEDEFAMVAAVFLSSYMSIVFPRRRELYDRYLTFRRASEQEIARWKDALMTFLRKLTLKYGKPLVLKSPPHTCRIRLLLEMFPDAKFVHIHRNPYAVFQSMQKLIPGVGRWWWLQRDGSLDLQQRILSQYREMYDAFFEERPLIPPDHFHEVCFEKLEADPVGQVREIYHALALPDFAEAEPALRAYVNSLADYKKNAFEDLCDALRRRIATEWRRCFDEWGYPVK